MKNARLIHCCLLAATPLATGPQASTEPSTPWSEASAAHEGSPWLAEVAREIRASEYRFAPVRGEPRIWSAPNRSQGLRSRALPTGPRGVPPLGRRAWPLGPVGSSSSVPRPSAAPGTCRELDEGELTVRGARVEIDRVALVEWFENGESGIEQGWTIADRPGGVDPLYIVLAVDGDISLRLDDGGRSGVFVGGDGTPRLAYRGLVAWDATGRDLEARLVSIPSGPAVELDDTGAVYPITVDPLITSPAWTLEADQAGAWFGGFARARRGRERRRVLGRHRRGAPVRQRGVDRGARVRVPRLGQWSLDER